MLTQLWTGLGGKLSERVFLALLSPAAAFWAVGVCAWLSGNVPMGRWFTEIRQATRPITGLPVAVQLALVLGLVALLVLSGQVIGSLTPVVLRLLEGYWPRRLAPARRALVGRVVRRRDRAAERWRALRTPPEDTLDDEERAELVRLDRILRRIPLLPYQQMPTRIGNVLRAAESRPVRKYGLDPVICWSHLWLLLPDTTRTEIGTARAALDRATAGVIWGVLLLVWMVWSLWAIPLALAVTAIAYLAAVRAALAYADLVEAAWDLYRQDLYASVRWPLPTNPAAEYETGRELTAYLMRGSRSEAPTFTIT